MLTVKTIYVVVKQSQVHVKSLMCWLAVMLAAMMFMLTSVLTKHNHHKQCLHNP